MLSSLKVSSTVRNERNWSPYLVTSLPAGEGAGKGHHICSEGHQEEAHRGQQAGRAHPLREEDPRRGSLAFCCQVSALSFLCDCSPGPEQIMSCQGG